ncbi:MAG TPA: ABC transporter permease [Fimbriimonadaceae bacterium]|nr:ABC transporter permease [Fimbriimonadaceae bacterium]
MRLKTRGGLEGQVEASVNVARATPRRRPSNVLLWFGVAYLVLLAVVAVVGPFWPYHYLDDQAGRPLEGASAQHWMGTDLQGRDVFARVAFGARMSLLVGLTVMAISLTAGIFMGSLSVYAPKWIRIPVMRLTDGMFAFPDILLAILIIGIWGMGVTPVIVALSITAWPGIARLTMTQIASLKDREFVVAAKAMGASTFYLVVRHVLPQLWGVLLAVAMVDLAATILAESTLSFLGIGIQPPTPSWGSMINDARDYLNSNPMLIFWPCLVLSLTIFALNFVGDGIRAMLDPRSR